MLMRGSRHLILLRIINSFHHRKTRRHRFVRVRDLAASASGAMGGSSASEAPPAEAGVAPRVTPGLAPRLLLPGGRQAWGSRRSPQTRVATGGAGPAHGTSPAAR